MIAPSTSAHRLIKLADSVVPHEAEARLISLNAGRYPCRIHISSGDKHGDAKVPEDVVKLCNEPGRELVIEAEGPRSEEAIDCLVHLVEDQLQLSAARGGLGVFGLLDLGGEGPEGLQSLGDLSDRDRLAAMGLLEPHPDRPQTLGGLPPRDALAAFALLR